MLQLFRGCIALVGPNVDNLVEGTAWHKPTGHSFPPTTTPYHITLITKEELRSLGSSSSPAQVLEQLQLSLKNNPPQLHALGLGGYPRNDPDIFFVVIIWANGQQLRKQLRFLPRHFHITLSQHDTHNIEKGVSSLLIELPLDMPLGLLDHLTFTLFMMGDYARAKEFALRLCIQSPVSAKGFLRLGDVSLKLAEHKLAMLSFVCALQRSLPSDQKAREYCIKKVVECSEHTEWGPVCADWEMEQLPSDFHSILLEPWSSALRSELISVQSVPTLCRESREQLFVPPLPGRKLERPWYKLPRFFRWLVPFHIALMSTPRNEMDIAALAAPHLNIRHVLTLTEETPLKEEWFTEVGIKNTFLPIPNYRPPTIEQMDLIIRIIQDEDNLPILIHCGGGKGRAGTVAACYLAAFGFAKPPDYDLSQPTMSATEAISALRAIRPGSIETSAQEAFVSKWCSTIWKRQSVFPDVIPELPPCPLEIEGKLEPASNLFIFVGLPGSGKSWVSRALLARDPSGWTWISQDEAGSRSACENAIGRSRAKGRTILDRCNTSRDDRKAWLALAEHWAISPVCVWFDYDLELCTSRAQNRAGHPTLPPGGRVRNAVEQMAKAYVRPSLAEGFAAITIIRSFTAAEEFVHRLSTPVTLFKFPRTPHLLNLGAASEDDLVSGSLSLPNDTTAHAVVTEKVDGANMGFSLSADRTQIVVQNRSHFVNPTSHEQFKKLGVWVETHREELYRVLGRDPYFAQRYILFGEWLAAIHSVSYTRLPDWFMAFDLYDRSSRTWVDRSTLDRLLAKTNIQMVPVLYEGPMVSEKELMDMVQRESQFCEARLEGVYVKFERDGKVVSRGKVVRAKV
ncbi:hypothetical protein EW026_g1451 [Hermanssonia centrifuga]|uniref:Tyrosine specific protein phosphatases domain-containing protein n=1 Tax=Hermanssonia centrifuga TaxID=98765 RepID=A0A4S4KSF7_9APHY|nr:hypothetical protein EW026_g1451 [Hermanssonia centrifuga]